jgi:membrane protein
VTAETAPDSGAPATGRVRGRVRARVLGTPAALWRLLRETVAACFRYRVTGLAAEAGFFALLSLPPLVLGLAASVGYVGRWLGEDVVAQVREQITEGTRLFLTERSVEDVILPTLDSVLLDGRFDLLSIGFLLCLWSGSRALNVYVDTITIMYGLGGHRGIVRTRALSFSLYIAALVLGAVILPLVLAGPRVVAQLLPPQLDALNALYWPAVTVLSVVFLASLYHISVPVARPWLRDFPGAALALLIWLGGSYVVRAVIGHSVGGPSIYGPLATPIIILIWLYVLAIAVLIGAALNAAVDRVWPHAATETAREHSGTHHGENPLTPLPEQG